MYQYSYSLPTLLQLSQLTITELSNLAELIALSHADYISSASSLALNKHVSAKHEFGISVALKGDKTTSGILQRLSRKSFWLEQIRKIADKSREEFAVRSRLLGFSREGKQAYCSDASYRLAKLSNRNNSRQTATASHQNYMTIKGYSEAAFEKGFRSIFITLTCPPNFHSSSPDYEYKTFEDAHQWLTDLYQALFGYVARKATPGVDFWGIRAVEVHADGCPHWHILIYADSHVEQLLRDRLRALYERESNTLNKYYKEHNAEIIKTRLPSEYAEYKEAISYIFKNSYAGKGSSRLASESAMRQRVAISCAGKRQYQLIGIKGGSKIKELRRHIKREPGIGGQAEKLIIEKSVGNRKRLQLDALKTLLLGGLENYVFIKKVYKNAYGEELKKTSKILYLKNNQSLEEVRQGKDCHQLALCLEVCTGFFIFCVGVIFNSSSLQHQLRAPEWLMGFIATERYGLTFCIRAPPV